MILDASYVAKCYLNETGSDEVRQLAQSQSSLACCEYGRIEVTSTFHRNLRQGMLTKPSILAASLSGQVSEVATLPAAVPRSSTNENERCLKRIKKRQNPHKNGVASAVYFVQSKSERIL